jgi:hypothetical protein
MTASGDRSRYVLLTDQPRVEGDDPLGYVELADRLAALVLDSRHSTPLAIGVLGGWGSGKSTLMRRLDTRLRQRDCQAALVETVWFNAWTAEGRSVLEGMIKSVLAVIGPRLVRRHLRRRRLLGGIRFASTVVLSWLGFVRLVDSVWEALSVDARNRNEMRDLLRESMEDWRRHGAASSGRLLVIFVDDLDRCSPGNVVEVFEAIRLYLDAPGFVFVIGYDDRMVSRTLRAEKRYEDAAALAHYLEKIVQIDYRLPVPDDGQAAALVADLVHRSGTSELLGAAERSLIADRTGRNPRRVKRFLNNFILARRVDPAAGEFHARESILLRLLAISSPPFFELLRASTERDAIAEYLDYVVVHDWARRRPEAAEEQVKQVFTRYGIPPPGSQETAEEALGRLRQDVAEEIPPLAEDRDFRSLLASFGDAAAREDLIGRLRRRPRPAVTVEGPDGGDGGYGPDPDRLDERPRGALLRRCRLMVLWLHSPHAAEPEEMTPQDVLVRMACSRSAAAEVLSEPDSLIDFLVVDTRHGRDPEAGFDDLAYIRNNGLYTGPAVFYASRITPDRRARATALRATITTSFADVLRRLTEVAETKVGSSR